MNHLKLMLEYPQSRGNASTMWKIMTKRNVFIRAEIRINEKSNTFSNANK